ncbi:MAG: lysine--tRNA ligase, partial [Candidatus Bathyarchaeia archaeon]
MSTELERSKYWADRIAKDAIAHSRRAARGLVTVRSAGSPSGGKHIGNMNDQVRAYFIHLAVKDTGYASRCVQTSDDMDPLRVVPSRLPDGEGEWRELSAEKVRELSRHLGKPVSRVDDPFDCHGSWAEHFTRLLDDGLNRIDVKLETYYVSEMYKKGDFDVMTRE